MGTGRRLLLADDSVTIQKVVNLTFADEGLDVTTVGNGDLAIEKIEEIAPDIVLADIHMPGLNGYEVCEFVKRNERFRHIPVMLLVGSFEPFDEAEARRVGADDYLTKPFQSIRQLVSMVGSLLSGKPASDETQTKELDKVSDPASETGDQADASLVPDMPIASDAPSEVAAAGADSIDAFADPSLDDALIEATPAGDFNMDRIVGGAQRATTPLNSTKLEDAVNQGESSGIQTEDLPYMYSGGSTDEGVDLPGLISDQSAQPARSVLGDDGLLDLGDTEPLAATRGNDESVLDLWNDAPAEDSLSASAAAESPIVRYNGDVREVSAPEAEVVDAEIIEGAPVVDVTPIQEPELEAVMVEPVVDAHAVPQPHAGLITLEQMSPEVIDAIARRAVEQLSEKVVEQIAWEVVPDLAERIIKRRLEEGK